MCLAYPDGKSQIWLLLGFGMCAADSSCLCIHKCEFENKSSPLLLRPSPTLLPNKAPHAHTQNHSLFVFNKYLSMLDMFLKTSNMTHPLSTAKQPSHQNSHQISVLAMRVYYRLLWLLKKCNSCNMVLCRETMLLPSNIFEVCSLLGLLEVWY